VPCEDLILQDLEILDNHRQGVSVISARHLLIENCRISGTSGTSPMSGIDFEPNGGDPGFVDCVVRRCRIEHNSGAGLLIMLAKLGPESTPVSITVQDCVIDNIPLAIGLWGLENHPRGTLVLSGNSVTGLQFLRGSSFFSVVSQQAP